MNPLLVPADGSLRGRRVGATSDTEERYARSKNVGDRLQVTLVGRDDTERESMGGDHDVDIHHIRHPGAAGQGTDLVRLIAVEADNLAATQETAELRLSSGPADLGDDRSGRDRHEAHLEPHAVVRPRGSVRSLGGDQCSGVVDDAHAERFLGRADTAPT